MGYTKLPLDKMIQKYYTQYKCSKCDNIEVSKFYFYPSCRICGNNSGHPKDRYYPVIGFWKTVNVPVRRRFLCFWWIGYKKEKVWVPKK